MRYSITYVSNEQNFAREMDMQENHSLKCDDGMFSTSNYYLNRSNESIEAVADTEKLCSLEAEKQLERQSTTSAYEKVSFHRL